MVLMDDRQGMCAAVSHLIEAHGRRRIAFLRGPTNHAGAQERYQGYLDALTQHGLVASAELVSQPPPAWVPEAAADAVTRMVARDEPLDGIAAANDDFAVAALSALTASGVGTPDGVAVVGFDDFTNIRTHDLGFDTASADRAGSVHRPVNVSAASLALTTVRAPFQEMARRAVELVLALIRGETVPDVVKVPTELIVRRSCGCRPTARGQASDAPVVPGSRTTGLRRVLAGRPAGLPPDWPELLSTAFRNDIRGKSRDVFLALLDQFVQLSVRSGDTVENWWRVLFRLRQLTGQPTPGTADATRAEEIWLHAQMLLNETADRQRRYSQVVTEKRNQIVREIGQNLITASDVAEVVATLAEELPKIGIPGCYVASYEPATDTGEAGTDAATAPVEKESHPRSRVVLAYENGVRTDLDADGTVFESVQLVPGGRLRRTSPYSMVAAPLYFKDEQLGFVLFELGPKIGWIYPALQEQLSAALHRAFLLERERVAVAAVAEAHRREERHRLAGELHDSVSQALFSMTLHTRAAQLAVQQQGGDPTGRVARGLDALRELTQGALTEMRALIFQLRPDALHQEGLAVAISKHAAALAAREGFEVRVHAPPDRLALDERAEVELFRVVQEALHNTVKHAHARRVDIQLYEPADTTGSLIVEVTDDGDGFDPDTPRPGHLGLETMHERARRLGGRLIVESSPAGSTTVRIVLPDIMRRPAAEASTPP
jgi:signal transduction histidine kinase